MMRGLGLECEVCMVRSVARYGLVMPPVYKETTALEGY